MSRGGVSRRAARAMSACGIFPAFSRRGGIFSPSTGSKRDRPDGISRREFKAIGNETNIREQTREALKRARDLQAARDDAIAAVRDVEALRLFALKQEIAPYVEAMPEAAGFIDLSLPPGNPPRLWLDLTSHVDMAEDARTWRLTQDTADGRVVLFETDRLEDMAAFARKFIAHRVLQRRKLLEEPLRPVDEPDETEAETAETSPARDETAGGYGAAVLWLVWLAGLLSGALALMAWMAHTGRL